MVSGSGQRWIGLGGCVAAVLVVELSGGCGSHPSGAATGGSSASSSGASSSGSSGDASSASSGASSASSSSGGGSGAYPGQPGNPVGYAAAPGYPGSLMKWTGGDTISQSGTAQNPLVYSFYDFVPSGQGGMLVTGSYVKFVGCRFQSNDVANYNVATTGSNISFEYCSVTPLVSLAPAPPHAAWPAAGAGKQLTGDGTGYQIGGNDGYQYGVAINASGPVTIDHCDIWGFGNAVTFVATSAQMTVNGSWIHDAADAAAQKYHSDGPGYLNGGSPPSNVAITNNTIASIGNTNAIAFQAASSPYQNVDVSGNYLSGFGYTADVCHETVGSTSITFTNNVLGTDLPWVFGPIYADPTNLFNQATNKWSGNKLKVLPGTTPIGGAWPWSAQDDGQYLWPDTTTHATDF